MSISNHYANQLTSGYYTLNQSGKGAGGVAFPLEKPADATPQGAPKPTTTAAFLLSLSPEAQDYLKSVGLAGETPRDPTTESFPLSDSQQQLFDTIIAKYKGKPFTQEVFNQIQNDLEAQGLSPDRLAKQKQIHDFNPTAELLSALNENIGNTRYDVVGQSSPAQYDTQKQNYVQQIIAAFQKIAAPAEA